MLKILRAAFGVGGGARRDNAARSFVVELQGDQQERVARILLDNNWVKGLAKDLIPQPKRTPTVVSRSKTSKYLAKTKDDADLSRLFEQGYDFLDNIQLTDEDVFDLHFEFYDEIVVKSAPLEKPMTDAELDAALLALGMLPCTGRAVLEPEQDGLTLDEYKRRGLAPGARLVTDGPLIKEKINALRGRQKITSWDNRISDGNNRRQLGGHYFQTCDERMRSYETGGVAEKQEEMGWNFETAADGSICGTCRMKVPWTPPATSCDQLVLLRKVMESYMCPLQGYEFRDPYIVLKVKEADIMGTNAQDKEAMKLEKKLREIVKLSQKPEAEVEKLQRDKIERRAEYFEALIYRKEYERQVRERFKEDKEKLDQEFFDLEWKIKYEDEALPEENDLQFECVDRSVSLEEKGRLARGERGWQNVRVAANVVKPEKQVTFGIEVVRGLVRVGFENLAHDEQWAYGGSGKKVQKGSVFTDYGVAYGAGDVIHATCGPEGISYAVNGKDFGVAFDLSPKDDVVGFVCGKDDFRVRLLFWQDDAPFEGEVFDPPKLATVTEQHASLYPGEVVNVSSRDGRGFCFVFYIDVEDGLWVPETCLRMEEDEAADASADAPYGVSDNSLYTLHENDNADAADDNDPTPCGFADASLLEPSPLDRSRSAGTVPSSNYFINAPTGPPVTNQCWDTIEVPQPSALGRARSAPGTAGECALGRMNFDGRTAGATHLDTPYVMAAAEPWYDVGAVPYVPKAPAFATPLPQNENPRLLSAPASKAVSEQIGVTGLSSWLQDLSLMPYEPQAIQWCLANGAVDLQEVLNNHADFCDALQMRPIEKRRVRKAVEK
eukprot:GEMP01002054.1.p1 GENE.GEMP01002054.1~~GEMP01002054.1.p1  ORF type:complete len:835 (+),score=206.89 GEMP01002054.1:377-2881(+)